MEKMDMKKVNMEEGLSMLESSDMVDEMLECWKEEDSKKGWLTLMTREVEGEGLYSILATNGDVWKLAMGLAKEMKQSEDVRLLVKIAIEFYEGMMEKKEDV